MRGRERSRRTADVLAEAERLAADGVVELTLLGQNVNSYGRDLPRDERLSFAELLRALDRVDGIERIRYTSPHPKDMRDDVIAAMAESPAVCEQLHLPLQSGSSTVLKRMRRTYTAERYLALVDRIRAAMPDIALTTDLIVGFPGETEEDFQATLDVCEQVGYDHAFTFIYSPRRGTEAAGMPDQVPEDVKGERLERLVEVIQRHARLRNEALVGTVQEVLVEGPSRTDPTTCRGKTRGGKTTIVAGSARARHARPRAHRGGDVADAARRGREPRPRVGRAMSTVVALFGPTASGKSAVAVALAERIGGEVVSADAMQCYRGLPILTNQPSADDLARVPHHCVAVWEPSEEGDVMRYAAMARAAIDDVLARGRVPIVAGGTGLYLRAALADLEPPPEPPPGLRERIAAGASDAGAARAPARARPRRRGAAAPQRPPARGAGARARRARPLARPGRRRRALERRRRAIRPCSWRSTCRAPSCTAASRSGRGRCSTAAWWRRCAALLARPEASRPTFARAHGLSDVIELLEGAPRAACEQRLVERTRQYAKRQQTWLQRLTRVHLVDGTLPVNEAAAQIGSCWRPSARGRLYHPRRDHPRDHRGRVPRRPARRGGRRRGRRGHRPARHRRGAPGRARARRRVDRERLAAGGHPAALPPRADGRHRARPVHVPRQDPAQGRRWTACASCRPRPCATAPSSRPARS